MILPVLLWSAFLIWSLRVSLTDETPPLIAVWQVFWSCLTASLVACGWGTEFMGLNMFAAAIQLFNLGAFVLTAPPPLGKEIGAPIVMLAIRIFVTTVVWFMI